MNILYVYIGSINKVFTLLLIIRQYRIKRVFGNKINAKLEY